MKTGFALAVAMCVIVCLATVGAAVPAPFPGLPDAGGDVDRLLEDLQGGEAPDPEVSRCSTPTPEMSAPQSPLDPPNTPGSTRELVCSPDSSEPEPTGPEPQPPTQESGALRDLIVEVKGSAEGEVETIQDTAGEGEKQARSLLERFWEPVQGLGQEASRVALETAAAIEDIAADAAAAAERTADNAIALIIGLVRGIGDLVNPPNADADDAPGVHRPAAAIEAPAVSPARMALGAIIAGGLGLALAAFFALRRLLGLGGIALLSRIPSAQIMKNETRNHIHDIVRSDPGVSLNEIVARMGISRNAVAYHLAVFESEEIMTSVKDGKYRRYFVNGGKYANGAKNVVSTIKNDVTRNVIRYIVEHPGAIQKEVCEAVGTSPSATSWHIRRLEKVGLVEKERDANMVRYRPGPSVAKYDLSDFGLQEALAPQPVGTAAAGCA